MRKLGLAIWATSAWLGCASNSSSEALGSRDGSAGADASGAASSGASGGSGGTSSGSSSGSSNGGSGAPWGGDDGGDAGGSGEGGSADAGKTPGMPGAGDVLVAPDHEHQAIDGFGAADVWNGPLSSQQVTLFFDPVNGIGLSLLRIGIETDGSPMGSGAVSDAKAASAFGVKVWAAPWSPPAMDKNNDSVNDGGALLSADYEAWASTLAAFPAKFKGSSGVQLFGVSAQNEPDFVAASYESCIYTADQMVAFVKVLGPKLAALDPPVALLAAEPDAWNNLWGGDSYGTAIEADPQAKAAVTILATHDYGHNASAPPAGVPQHIWETEVSDETAPDVDIGHGVQVAQWVYSALVTGGASAWHYWWLVNLNTDGEGLLNKDGSTTKRLYTVGNFSKFVRPGYVRVDVSGPVPSGVDIVGFKNPADATTVIVAINANSASATVPVFVGGSSWPGAVTPWVTSATADLASQAAVPVTAGRFMATLGGESVTTFVGEP